jgi:hypothetical protein
MFSYDLIHNKKKTQGSINIKIYKKESWVCNLQILNLISMAEFDWIVRYRVYAFVAAVNELANLCFW